MVSPKLGKAVSGRWLAGRGPMAGRIMDTTLDTGVANARGKCLPMAQYLIKIPPRSPRGPVVDCGSSRGKRTSLDPWQ